MKRKIIRAAAAALLMSVLASGCGDVSSPPVTSDMAVTTEAPSAGLDIYAQGDCAYKIIRYENASSGQLKAVSELKKGILEKTGFDIAIATDWINEQYGMTESDYEIVVGATERTESEEAMKKSQLGGYVICVIGKKVVINAPTDKLLSLAVNDFLNNYITEDRKPIPETLFMENILDKTPIKSVTINGVNIRDYVIIVPNIANTSYGSAGGVLQKYLEKYCASSLAMKRPGTEKAPHEIIIGNTSRSETKAGVLTSRIYMKDGDIYLCGGSVSDCEQVVNMFISKYLSGSGDISVTIPDDGSVQYEWSDTDPEWPVPANYTLQDQILMSCKKLQHYLEYDKAHGFSYTYENSGYVSTWKTARAQKNGKTNCVILFNWALKDLGLWDSGIINHLYNDTFGYTISSGKCTTCVNEMFDIIKIDQPEALRSLISKGQILPGDIIFFMNHNQIIIDDQRAFDGGSGNTGHSGQKGYAFERFIGGNPALGMKVGYIFRAKDAE